METLPRLTVPDHGLQSPPGTAGEKGCRESPTRVITRTKRASRPLCPSVPLSEALDPRGIWTEVIMDRGSHF